jgi:hypothetical protein
VINFQPPLTLEVGAGEMLHQLSHATSESAFDVRVCLCLKIGAQGPGAVQHGSTAVGATELAAVCRLMPERKHDHIFPTPMPEVRDEEAAGSNPVTPTSAYPQVRVMMVATATTPPRAKMAGCEPITRPLTRPLQQAPLLRYRDGGSLCR